MIKSLPGWLNFFLLWIFYSVLFGGIYLLLKWLFKFDQVLSIMVIMSAFYAGAYLAKWREKQGGGWVFW